MFQSRKGIEVGLLGLVNCRFNLVIKNLISSSHLYPEAPTCWGVFVIFSSEGVLEREIATFLFQSRNRESYLFKENAVPEQNAAASLFQSRNRESYLFKSIIVIFRQQ